MHAQNMYCNALWRRSRTSPGELRDATEASEISYGGRGARLWFPGGERSCLMGSVSPRVAGAASGGHRKVELTERNASLAAKAVVAELKRRKGGVPLSKKQGRKAVVFGRGTQFSHGERVSASRGRTLRRAP